MSSDILECKFKWKKIAFIMQILMLAVSWHHFLQRINLSPLKQKRSPLKVMRQTRSEIDLCQVKKSWMWCRLCKWLTKKPQKQTGNQTPPIKNQDWREISRGVEKEVQSPYTRKSYSSIERLIICFCEWNKLIITLKDMKNAMNIKIGPRLARNQTFTNSCARNIE